MMNRRALLLSVLVLPLAGPVHAAKLSLDALSDYLNSIASAEADFTQINADGSQSAGRVYIKRPGRMRFEYAGPEQTLVLASGGQVAIFDGKSNQPPEEYPLSKTPLNLILGADIDLGRARMVVAHAEEGALTVVTAQDPEHPEFGTLRLAFTDNPVALRQWVVTDETGSETVVLLAPLSVGADYPPSLFSIRMETDKRVKD